MLYCKINVDIGWKLHEKRVFMLQYFRLIGISLFRFGSLAWCYQAFVISFRS